MLCCKMGVRSANMLRQAKAQFKRRSTANNVEISIPVPDDADTPRFRTNIGSVHYAPETSSIVWKIKQFGGNKEFLMRAELGLPSVRGDEERGGGMMGKLQAFDSGLFSSNFVNRRLWRLDGRRRRKQQGQTTHRRQVRNSILHHFRHPGQVPEDH